MAEQVTDLSKLTDEQLGVYRDLLAKKQQPAEKPAPAQPGFSDSFYNTVQGPRDVLHGISEFASSPIQTLSTMGKQTIDLGRGAVDSFKRGDYLGSLRRGLNTAVNGLVPGLGAASEDAGEEFDRGNYGAALGKTAGVGINAAAVDLGPRLVRGAGKVLESGSPKLAEAAMRVGKGDRLTDANPGKALIEETSSVRPASIARDLNAKKTALGNEATRLAAASPNPVDFSRAESPLITRQSRAHGAGATTIASELQPMRDYWSGEPEPGFTGAVNGKRKSLLQPPAQALQMRREFGPNFRIRYGPMADRSLQQAGRESYGGATRAIKDAVPGIVSLDDRIHDIIPAAKAAESTSRNAGVFQRTAGRIAAHTGALTAALAGGHYFGPWGAATGLIVPELMADPTSMMLGARGLNFAGRTLKRVPTAAGIIPGAIAGSGNGREQ